MENNFDASVILSHVKEVGRIFLAEFRQKVIPQTRQDFMAALKSIEDRSLNELRKRIDPLAPGIPWADDDEFDGEAQMEPAAYHRYWLCDTMDGAVQYLQHIAGWSINLVLIQDGRPHFSVIYDPFQDELFWGLEGRGSFLNGVKLQASSKQEAFNMLAVIEYGHQLKRSDGWEPKVGATFTGLLSKFGVVRNYGPHGLQLAYLGAGRIDLFLQDDLDTHNWLAGMLIAREAGAVVLSSDGSEWRWGSPNLLAGTSEAVNMFLAQESESI